MAILGGTLAALLLVALIFLGVMLYKQYGKKVNNMMRKKVGAFFGTELPQKWEWRRF